MDVKTINRLAEIMAQHGLTELSLEQDQVKLHLARTPVVQQRNQAAVELPTGDGGGPAVAGGVRSTAIPPAPAAEVITSPLVGTFYAAASPEAMPYVSAGSKVKAGDVLCIVEAMKVMNEIKADRNGVVQEIKAINGKMVEYNQALVRIGDAP